MMNPQSKASFSQKRPVLTVVIIEVLLTFALIAAGAYVTMNELEYSPALFAFIPIALALVLYMTLKRKWGYLGFRPLSTIPSENRKYYAPLLIILLIILLKGFQDISISEVMYYLAFTLLVGFVEETLYRGLIFKTLLAKGVTTAVITSSILFSVTHMLNAIGGQSVPQTVLQVVYALLIGAVLVLLMLKNNNILPLIFFHFIHNFIQFVGNANSSTLSGYDLLIDLLILAVLAAHCFWLILSFRKPASSIPVKQAS
ncbi:CPBP family intramembrane metalloprotease [Paenibacillus sp. PK3_47]|uniref:CPBP family intramembrane glutamic endopeptidase n=1 Tax=Paenibacillus sp. PK3_47 TaxID=2072642 RepID=UPI00201D8767|nr:CPBP family intramembrane glutamic endopeptidase [Paenibacillus sp. PK3_47]UQZ34510.1 CPBP family intramembrane metalloprotease [Paenibacillus sp. PK3_47]